MTTTTKTKATGAHVLVDYKKLRDPADNVRTTLTDIDQLAASIVEVGLLQELTVEEMEDGTFTITSGFRRHAAIGKLIAAKQWSGPVPCSVRAWADAATRRIAMLIENLQRVDLDPVDEAFGIQTLVIEHGITAKQVAQRLNRSESHVKERIALCGLPDAAIALVREGKLQLGVAAALAKAPVALIEKLCAKPDYRISSVSYVESEIKEHKKAETIKTYKKAIVATGATFEPQGYGRPTNTKMVFDGKIDTLKQLNEFLSDHSVGEGYVVHVGFSYNAAGCVLRIHAPVPAEDEIDPTDHEAAAAARVQATRAAEREALTAGGLIVDDSRIVRIDACKVEVDGWTGATIELRRVGQVLP